MLQLRESLCPVYVVLEVRPTTPGRQMRALLTEPHLQSALILKHCFEQSSGNSFKEYWGEKPKIIQNPTVSLEAFIFWPGL